MKTCTQKDDWNPDFDFLSKDEFEALLLHAEKCGYHAYLLNKYNHSMMPLMQKVVRNVQPREANKAFAMVLGRAADLKSIPLPTAELVLGGTVLTGVMLASANLNLEDPVIRQALLTTAALACMLPIFSVMQSQRKFALAGKGIYDDDILPFNEFEGSLVGKSTEKLQPSCITEEEKRSRQK